MKSRTLACLAGLMAATAAHAQAPVTTAQGEVQGKPDGAATAYLGIPYAAPPVGALRWQPPQPPAPWPGVRAARAVAGRAGRHPVWRSLYADAAGQGAGGGAGAAADE